MDPELRKQLLAWARQQLEAAPPEYKRSAYTQIETELNANYADYAGDLLPELREFARTITPQIGPDAGRLPGLPQVAPPNYDLMDPAERMLAEEQMEIYSSPVQNFLEAAASTPTFGMGGAMVEGLGNVLNVPAVSEYGEGMQQRQAMRGRATPVFDATAQTLGAFIPVGGLMAAGRMKSVPHPRRMALQGAARGGAIGIGAAGAAGAGFGANRRGVEIDPTTGEPVGFMNAFFKDGTDTFADAVRVAPWGFLGGVLPGAAAGLHSAYKMGKRGIGQRIAEAVDALTGLDATKMPYDASINQLTNLRKSWQQAVYKPFERRFGTMTRSPELEIVLNRMANDLDPDINRLVPQHMRPVQVKAADGSPIYTSPSATDRTITFEQLQSMHQTVTDAAFKGGRPNQQLIELADDLTDAIDGMLGAADAAGAFDVARVGTRRTPVPMNPAATEAGEATTSFRAANAVYREINDRQRALEAGWSVGKTDLAPEVRLAREDWRRLGEQVLEAYDRGRRLKVFEEIRLKERGAVGKLKEMMNAGPAEVDKIRLLVGDDNWPALEALLEANASAERMAAFFDRILGAAVVGAVGGFIAGSLMSPESGNN